MGDDGDDDDCSYKLNWFGYGTRIKQNACLHLLISPGIGKCLPWWNLQPKMILNIFLMI